MVPGMLWGGVLFWAPVARDTFRQLRLICAVAIDQDQSFYANQCFPRLRLTTRVQVLSPLIGDLRAARVINIRYIRGLGQLIHSVA